MQISEKSTSPDSGEGLDLIKETASNETRYLEGQGCVQCLNGGNRYCFVKFSLKDELLGGASNQSEKASEMNR